MPKKDTRSVHVRFWEKVDVQPGQCWLWRRPRFEGSYGVFYVTRDTRVLAHRLSLMWDAGPPPPHKPLALHRCNTKPCVNPRHLYWGDKRDNALDAIKAGMKPGPRPGALNGRAKLEPSDVRACRLLLREGYSNKDIAHFFSVSPSTIARIKSGKGWRFVP